MKRLTFTTAAVLSVAFGFSVLVGVISLGSDRADRWAVIGAFGVLMLSFGVLTATKDDAGEASTPRGLVRTSEPLDLPAAPGSLHGKVTPQSPQTSPFGLVEFHQGVPVGRFEDLNDLEDPSDLDASSLSDSGRARNPNDQSVDEGAEAADEFIVDLTAPAAHFDDDAAPTQPPPASIASDSGLRDVEIGQVVDTVFLDEDPWDLDHVESSDDADTLSTAAASLSLLGDDPSSSPLHLDDYSDADLMAIVKESEATVIRSMIASGQLSSSGPLTERDVATMIFLAYTSNDMLIELRLRKVTSQPLLHSSAEIA